MTRDQKMMAGAIAGVVVLMALAFVLGRATAPTSDVAAPGESTTTIPDAPGDTTTGDSDGGENSGDAPSTTIEGNAAAGLPPYIGTGPQYGTAEERDALIDGLVNAGIGGGTREFVLGTADHVCHMLEVLQEQRRSPAFAVRVVWNESLSELNSEDLAAYAAVFNAAPHFLCPDSLAYAERVTYWLGI